MEPRKLVALRDPLAPVEFPNGRVLALREIDAPLAKLIAEVQFGPPEQRTEARYHEIFSRIVPDATDEDWGSLTSEDLMNVLLLAGEKLDAVKAMVEERRKNGLAGMIALVGHTRPSSPTTTTPMSAPESPAPTPEPADTGMSSRPPTGKPSSPSMHSTNSNASTTSSPTSSP